MGHGTRPVTTYKSTKTGVNDHRVFNAKKPKKRSPKIHSWKLRKSIAQKTELLRSICFIILQSIYVTRDRLILKFEARVQIYVAVLNFGCEIQNSGGNVVSFSKINSFEISFELLLLKNMRIIRFLGVWWNYLAVNSRISERLSEKTSTFRWNVESYREDFECSFQFRFFRSRVK